MTSPVPLNLFQRLLRQWEAVHPYNAAQVMELRAAIDAGRATCAWHEAMRSLGLGRVRAGKSSFTYDIPGGVWLNRPIHEVNGGGGGDLSAFLTDQLNRPFNDPEEPPFRPFIVPGEGTCHIGVVYQHWLADSVSIRQLMREWFLRLFDPAAVRDVPARQPTNGYWSLFGPQHSNWPLVLGLINTFRRYFRYRRVRKIDSAHIDDPVVHVQLHDLPGVIDGVVRYASENHAKVNDVFVASVADLCRRFVPLQARAKRADIAVGSIVDLRPLTSIDLREVFGIFLGFDGVVCTPRDLSNWDTLLRAVAKQSRLSKSLGTTQTSLIWMASALMVGHFSHPKKLFHFYRKDLPLAGGVSNVNLNHTWAGRYHPDPIVSYARVSPAGPMTPIVFTTTTLGSTLQVSVTYRRGLIGDDRARRMTEAFFERLKSLTTSTKGEG